MPPFSSHVFDAQCPRCPIRPPSHPSGSTPNTRHLLCHGRCASHPMGTTAIAPPCYPPIVPPSLPNHGKGLQFHSLLSLMGSLSQCRRSCAATIRYCAYLPHSRFVPPPRPPQIMKMVPAIPLSQTPRSCVNTLPSVPVNGTVGCCTFPASPPSDTNLVKGASVSSALNLT
jgi:hypothetical protein